MIEWFFSGIVRLLAWLWTTTRAAVDFALRMVVGGADQRDMLDLEATGWDAELDELRPGTDL